MTREKITSVAGSPGAAGHMMREEIDAFFARRQEAIDNLDAAALAAEYAEDCVVESPTAGTLRGRAAVEVVFRAWFDAFPDVKFRTESLVVDGDRVAQVATFEGTDIGGFMGLAPTGKTFRVPIVSFYTLKDHTIVEERRIYDFTGVLMQVGVLKAKPA